MMPTERFYRLSKAKQNVICEAIRKEFRRVPVEKASINQIIHNADISRGSFYTYFTDKYDALQLMVDEDLEDARRICGAVLKQNGGDLIQMFQDMFEHFAEMMKRNGEFRNIVKNVPPGQHDSNMLFGLADNWIDSEVNEDEKQNIQHWIRELYDQVNQKSLNIHTREEFSSLLIMGIHAVLYSLKQYYNNPDRLDVIRNLLRTKLDILRYGACRMETMAQMTG